MNPKENINCVNKKKTKTLKPVKEENISGSKTRKSTKKSKRNNGTFENGRISADCRIRNAIANVVLYACIIIVAVVVF